MWGEFCTSSHRKHLKSTVLYNTCVAVSPLPAPRGRVWPTAGGKCLCMVCLKYGRRKTKRYSTAHRFKQRDSRVLASVHLLSFLKIITQDPVVLFPFNYNMVVCILAKMEKFWGCTSARAATKHGNTGKHVFLFEKSSDDNILLYVLKESRNLWCTDLKVYETKII